MSSDVVVKVQVGASGAEQTAETARERRGQITSDLLPMVLFGLVAVYLAHTLFHAFARGGTPILALGTGVTALAFAIGAIVVRHHPVPSIHAERVAVAVGAAILANIAVHYALRPTVETVVHFVIFMLAASALLLEAWAVTAVLATSVAVWFCLALVFAPDHLSGPAALDIVIALCTGLVLRQVQEHILRVLLEGEARLHAARKLEAVGRLAGGVAHDFNNQLTVIRLNARLAMRTVRKSGDDEAVTDLRDLMVAADRAAALTEDLLTLARRGPPAMDIVDVGQTVAAVSSSLARVLGEGIELKVAPASASAPVRMNAAVLERVVLELAQNARDAMPFGGRLELVVEDATGEPPLVPGRYVCLRVRDNGVGMDDSTRVRLFEPFFTTKARGTGLGLATAYGAVQQSGGTIVVESRLGQGAEFRVYLPVAAVASPASAA